MENLNDLDTSTKEGKYLFAALVILTQSTDIRAYGRSIDGRNTSPDEMLAIVGEKVEAIELDKVRDKLHEQVEAYPLTESTKKEIGNLLVEFGLLGYNLAKEETK